jgi:hypothetical protein
MQHEKKEAQGLHPLGLKTVMKIEDIKQADNLGNQNSQDEDEPFDWANDPAVILHDQAAVAAYFNPFGELAVKQRDTFGEEVTIFVTPENVERFLKGLSERAGPLPTTKRLRVIDGGSTT